jgi:hypothetical protein
MARSKHLSITYERVKDSPAVTVSLSHPAACLIVFGAAVGGGGHLENQHALLGTLAESITPERLRGYIVDDSAAAEAGVNVDDAIEMVLSPVRWMQQHCVDRLPWVTLKDGIIGVVLSIPDFASLLAMMSRMARDFEVNSPQNLFLLDAVAKSQSVLGPTDLMALWDAASDMAGRPNN